MFKNFSFDADFEFEQRWCYPWNAYQNGCTETKEQRGQSFHRDFALCTNKNIGNLGVVRLLIQQVDTFAQVTNILLLKYRLDRFPQLVEERPRPL
jgi:hypothetical protein